MARRLAQGHHELDAPPPPDDPPPPLQLDELDELEELEYDALLVYDALDAPLEPVALEVQNPELPEPDPPGTKNAVTMTRTMAVMTARRPTPTPGISLRSKGSRAAVTPTSAAMSTKNTMRFVRLSNVCLTLKSNCF